MLLRILGACIDPVGHSQYIPIFTGPYYEVSDERVLKTRAMDDQIERTK